MTIGFEIEMIMREVADAGATVRIVRGRMTIEGAVPADVLRRLRRREKYIVDAATGPFERGPARCYRCAKKTTCKGECRL